MVITLAAIYALVLTTAYASAQVPASTRTPRGGTASEGPPATVPGERRRPVATGAALLAVGVPTLLQLTVAPSLLGDLQRSWSAISSGQVWRLVTSLVVQDSGLPGAVFNLVSLAVIGSVAEAAWGVRRWTVLALASGVGAQFWGRVVQPVGAGNSVLVFGLAASLAVLAVRRSAGFRRLLGSVSLLGSAVLLVLGDLHGGAAAIGVVLAALFLRARQVAPIR